MDFHVGFSYLYYVVDGLEAGLDLRQLGAADLHDLLVELLDLPGGGGDRRTDDDFLN